jgi:hypothetical protein
MKQAPKSPLLIGKRTEAPQDDGAAVDDAPPRMRVAPVFSQVGRSAGDVVHATD